MRKLFFLNRRMWGSYPIWTQEALAQERDWGVCVVLKYQIHHPLGEWMKISPRTWHKPNTGGEDA